VSTGCWVFDRGNGRVLTGVVAPCQQGHWQGADMHAHSGVSRVPTGCQQGTDKHCCAGCEGGSRRGQQHAGGEAAGVLPVLERAAA
jgi:hypothetical protein